MLIILVKHNRDHEGCVASSIVTLIPNLMKSLSGNTSAVKESEDDGRMDTGVRALVELMIT
jgi:hypothetical protein